MYRRHYVLKVKFGWLHYLILFQKIHQNNSNIVGHTTRKVSKHVDGAISSQPMS